MSKYFVGGYEVSLETKIESERQEERARQHEYQRQQREEELRLLRKIAEQSGVPT